MRSRDRISWKEKALGGAEVPVDAAVHAALAPVPVKDGGCVFCGAAIASAFPPDVELLCAARFVIGLGVGTASFVAPMYISEQSPKHLRGGMTAFNQLMITFGIMIAYLSDYGFSGFGADNWRWMFAIEAIPGAAPGHRHGVRAAHAALADPERPAGPGHGGPEADPAGADVDDEIDGIKNVVQLQRKTRLWQALTSRRLLPFLVIGVVLAALQQAVGINAVIYFGAQDRKFMGYTTNAAVYEAITIGIVNFVFALVAVLLLDWVGRKVLLIVSTAGMVAAPAAEGWYWAQGSSYAHASGLIGLGLTLAFLAFFELGIGPVTWVLIAEIYPLRVRSKAMAIATMVNWTFNFLVAYFYLTMFKPGVLGRDGTMWFFAGFVLIALVFTIWKVPETKNRSLEEIETEVLGSGPAEDQARPEAA